MKNLFHQTKQAFYFSLVFYVLGALATILNFSFETVVISISLLLSLIWVVLVLREIMLSKKISDIERILLVLFIIFGNILAGIIYFIFIREHVIGKKLMKS